MKKNLTAILLTFFVLTTYSVQAQTCSNQNKVKLKKEASLIKVSRQERSEERDPYTYYPPEGWPEGEDGPFMYRDYFEIKFLNIQEDIYIRLENNINDEIKIIRYDDTDDGTYYLDWKDLSQVTTFKYTIYASEKSPCFGEELFKSRFTLPMLNRYYSLNVCQGLEEFALCQKYLTREIGYEEFKRGVDKYKKTRVLERPLIQAPGSDLKNRRIAFAVSTLALIGGVAMILVVIKKRKKLKLMKNKSKLGILVFITFLALMGIPNSYASSVYDYKITTVNQSIGPLFYKCKDGKDCKVTGVCRYGADKDVYACLVGVPKFTLTKSNGKESKVSYDQVYCYDPPAAIPAVGSFYRDVTNEYDEKQLAALANICKTTAGDDEKRGAALKLYAMSYNAFRHNNSKYNYPKLYKDLVDNPNDWKTVSSNPHLLNQAIEVKDNASKYKVIKLPEIKKLSENQYEVIPNGVKGKIIVTAASGLEVMIELEKTNEKVVDPTKKYRVALTTATCNSGTELDFVIAFYPEDATILGKDWQAKVFAAQNSADQRLVACIPPYAGKTDRIETTGKVICPDEPENCEPDTNLVKDGLAICDANGTTVVAIKELAEENPRNIEGCLLKDGKDYAGNDIKASQLVFNNLKHESICGVYCLEDYSLILPGPDARNAKDPNVFINAGTFFTIDDTNNKIQSKTTLKCFGYLNNGLQLIQKINEQRANSVTAYNNYQDYLATRDYECKANTVDQTTTYTLGFKGNYSYVYFKDGNFVKGEVVNHDVSTPFNSEGDCQKQANAIRASYVNYNKSYLISMNDKYSQEIDELVAYWNNECLGWNLDKMNTKLFNQDCSTPLDFHYYDGDTNYGNPKIEVQGSNITNSKVRIEKENNQKTVSTGVCGLNGCDNKTTKSLDANGAYREVSEEVTVNYAFNNYWCAEVTDQNLTPVQNQKTVLLDGENSECNGYKFKGFPVSLSTSQGKYYYRYEFAKLGHYFNHPDCSLGRLSDVVQVDGDKNFTDTCYYDVNSCGDCEVICTPGNCELEDKCDTDCQVSCVEGGCILDENSDFLAVYRTLSLNNPRLSFILNKNPLNIIAMISSTQDFKKTNWNTIKGQNTGLEIKNNGEKIYNKEPSYSIVLDSNKIRDIREDNTLPVDYQKLEGHFTYDNRNEYYLFKSNFIDNYEVKCNPNSNFDSYFDYYPGQPRPFEGPAWK